MFRLRRRRTLSWSVDGFLRSAGLIEARIGIWVGASSGEVDLGLAAV